MLSYISAVLTALLIVLIISPTFRTELLNFFGLGFRKEIPAKELRTKEDAEVVDLFDETQSETKRERRSSGTVSGYLEG